MQNYAHETSQKIIKHKQLMDPSNSSKKTLQTWLSNVDHWNFKKRRIQSTIISVEVTLDDLIYVLSGCVVPS